jgi:hypothetical protein
MKQDPVPTAAAAPTLQDVLERLGGEGSRLRDYRSAVSCYAKLVGRPAAGTALSPLLIWHR